MGIVEAPKDPADGDLLRQCRRIERSLGQEMMSAGPEKASAGSRLQSGVSVHPERKAKYARVGVIPSLEPF